MTDNSGFSREELRAFEQARSFSQPLAGGCMVCGETWSGTVGECLEISKAHREKEHPDLPLTTKRRRRSARALHSFRTLDMDDESKTEIDQERKKRAFLHGVEITE